MNHLQVLFHHIHESSLGASSFPPAPSTSNKFTLTSMNMLPTLRDARSKVCKHRVYSHWLVVRVALTWQSGTFCIPDTIRLRHWDMKQALNSQLHQKLLLVLRDKSALMSQRGRDNVYQRQKHADTYN